MLTPDGGGALIESESEAGVSALHPKAPEPPVVAAPATGSEFNAIHSLFLPIACWRVEDLLFDFDSSFVKPVGQSDLRALKRLREKLKQLVNGQERRPPLSIFGHADPVGSEDYNKQLSGRRAMAIFALLVRDVDLWEKLFSQPFGRDDWGVPAVQNMLRALGFDPGPIAKASNDAVKAAVRLFQAANGLKDDGNAGPKTRKVLFLAYMDFLCGKDFVLDKQEDFLARGADKDGKGDFQGCSEFNPVLLFSKTENAELGKPENDDLRNVENEPNRRVVALLFAPGRRIEPARWPCPRAKEGTAGCKNRFFADADKRRAFADERRERPSDKNTFACRFYDRMAHDSPCESTSAVLRIRVYDANDRFIPDAPFALTVPGEAAPRAGRADRRGFIRVRRVASAEKAILRWGAPPAAGAPIALPFEHTINLQIAGDDAAQAERRLNNLGYVGDTLAEKIVLFKKEHPEIFSPDEVNEQLDAKTRAAIEETHDSLPDDTTPSN